jgi:hypothetical protein
MSFPVIFDVLQIERGVKMFTSTNKTSQFLGECLPHLDSTYVLNRHTKDGPNLVTYATVAHSIHEDAH